MRGTVILRKFKMKDAKMDNFMTVLSKSESFNFEYADNEGFVQLTQFFLVYILCT